ncbi:MAG: SPOR domain-containing protein [Candidatus Margulisbacteria bacterium]|nr:SPOR domain-containing protein [Candidatus Margulisiibacteriota bacterium]
MTLGTSDINDDLEYNDGLGDMLKEKEYHEFSWIKTLSVLVGILAIVLILFVASFKFGTDMFSKSQTETAVEYEDIIVLEGGEEIIIDDIGSGRKGIAEDIEIIYIEDTGPGQSQDQKTTSIKEINAPSSSASFRVIAGSFSSYENALRFQKSLSIKQLDAFVWKAMVNYKKMYRVQIGSYQDYPSAMSRLNELKNMGVTTFIVTH